MFYNSSYEYNDCVSKGACSISPNLSSMQEILFEILKQTSYFLINLKEFNVYYDDIVYDIIYRYAFIDSIKDLSETQVLGLFSKHYMSLVKVRNEYLKLCKESNTKCHDIKGLIKLTHKTSLSELLKLGEKLFVQKYKKQIPDKKYYLEILLSVLKSVCANWVYLNDYDCECNDVADTILSAVNLFNAGRISSEKLKSYINRLSVCYIELLKLINDMQIENFGSPQKMCVSHSTRPNKAIMVAGSSLIDLKNLLNSVSDIDVYTNGNLFVAHTFPYFKKFSNLIGHFGNSSFNTMLDFATFPGAILLTQNEFQNIEYLYRGRLFTTDKIPPKGVVGLKDNDFSPLINSALQAKGFAKGQKREPKVIGYDLVELDKKFENIIKKNPDYIFIIGLSDNMSDKFDYFKKFYSIMPKNSYAITFSFDPEMENVLKINIGNNYPLLYGLLEKLFEKIPVNSEKLVFFMTKCDTNSMSNIINLKNNGAKNIFMSDCPPLVINPSVQKAFKEIFKINNITTPKDDLELLKKGKF